MNGGFVSMMLRNRRWSGDDRHLFPFTLSRDSSSYRAIGLVLKSGDDEHPGCAIRLHVAAWTLHCELPQWVLKPWREWHDLLGYEWANNDGYWESHERQFGFTWVEDAIHYYFGPQTNDSRTTKSGLIWVPWRNWRFIRTSFYGLHGEHMRTFDGTVRIGTGDWRAMHEYEHQVVPKCRFLLRDYDGQEIVATTHIEEREWRLGNGVWRWLSVFRRPKVRRSLSIDFDKETGREKGSWKGGTVGHSIDMLPGELHEAAMRRYCDQEHRSKSGPYKMTFVEALP